MTTTALDLLLEDLRDRPWGTIRAQVENRLTHASLALRDAQEGKAPIGHAGEHISQAVAILELFGERIRRLEEEAFQAFLNSKKGVAMLASRAAEREAAEGEAA